ncbi:unnamed protein product [Citrullus colocynthis]|uniref:Uncharacterized protein n=1 Tax=Citrullus colocynthis TaxID=252529 RepID=A0ABP0Z843_9ROSI
MSDFVYSNADFQLLMLVVDNGDGKIALTGIRNSHAVFSTHKLEIPTNLTKQPPILQPHFTAAAVDIGLGAIFSAVPPQLFPYRRTLLQPPLQNLTPLPPLQLPPY